ncbi:MAG: hypothetical protein ACRENB_05410 [Gemmatimonadales bacterium]
MAFLWIRTPSWTARLLDRDEAELGMCEGDGPAARLIRDEEHDLWAMIAGGRDRVWVNGIEPLAGMQVLEDRDEVLIAGGERIYFAADGLPRIESYSGAPEELLCPRCRQPLEAGAPAVRCPRHRCGLWHHQSAGLPCWTYSPTCAQCSHPTALAAAVRWQPEDD